MYYLGAALHESLELRPQQSSRRHYPHRSSDGNDLSEPAHALAFLLQLPLGALNESRKHLKRI